MPASGVISLPDANVWLALAFSDHVHNATATAWFGGQPEESCGFCRVTQMALLRHLTNSRIMGTFVRSQRSAWLAYDQLVRDPRVTYIHEPPGLGCTLRRYTQAESVSHALWTDAYLAAFAVESQMRLVTFDRGFTRFGGLYLDTLLTAEPS